MKIAFLSILAAVTLAGAANASDIGYTETETYTNREVINVETITFTDGTYKAPCAHKCGCAHKSSLDVARARPCAKAPKLEPVRVKTHTEVIDHYTVYEPVVTYRAAGTYAHRRIVPTCNRCGK